MGERKGGEREGGGSQREKCKTLDAFEERRRIASGLMQNNRGSETGGSSAKSERAIVSYRRQRLLWWPWIH